MNPKKWYKGLKRERRFCTLKREMLLPLAFDTPIVQFLFAICFYWPVSYKVWR